MLTESMILALLGTLFGAVGVAITAVHIDRLWRGWKGELVHRHIAAICSIVPAWAILSWFCIVFPDRHSAITILIDTYEAFVVFNFMEMMKEYLGGYKAAARKFKNVPPFRFCRCCFMIHPSEKSLFYIQILVYQFCLLKPAFSLLRAFLEHTGVIDPYMTAFGSTAFWLTVAKLLSLVVAMMALLIFYRCTSKSLSRYNVVMKFLVIKVLISIHVAQNLAFKFFINMDLIKETQETAEIRAIRIQYLLSVIEMTILAFSLPFTYPIHEKKLAIQEELGMESFKLVTQDVPHAFDARSVDTFMDGTRVDVEEAEEPDHEVNGTF